MVCAACPLRPHRARGRDLDQRQQLARGHRQRPAVVARPLLLEPLPQLLEGQRPLLDQVAGRRGEPVQVDAGQLLAEAAAQGAVVHGAGEGPQQPGVAGAHEMDGGAHHRDADGLPGLQEAGQLLRAEAGQPRGERVVRRPRRLGLQSEQPLHRVECGHITAAQQELTFQSGTAEGAGGECGRGALRHADDSTGPRGQNRSATAPGVPRVSSMAARAASRGGGRRSTGTATPRPRTPKCTGTTPVEECVPVHQVAVPSGARRSPGRSGHRPDPPHRTGRVMVDGGVRAGERHAGAAAPVGDDLGGDGQRGLLGGARAEVETDG